MRSTTSTRVARSVAIAALIALAVAGALLLFAKLRPNAPPYCRAPATSPTPTHVAIEPMFGGAIFERLVQIVQHPAEPDTWIIVLHRGIIQRFRDGKVTTVLDITDKIHYGEQWGLQEIALHPEFPADPRVFVTYVGPGSVSTVAMLRTLLDGEDAETPSPVVFFEEAQPSDWHPIGGLAFGPDGYLYVGWGYGDLEVYDPTMLRGKMLRVDVDRAAAAKPYAIPADNPFLDSAHHPAIYATGLRNPWRFSFDVPTGALWLGDVGESGYEEINRIVSGKNYGWPQWEGITCRAPEECARFPTEPPVYQHTHAEICAVIGGYVYRGNAIPYLRGKYVYGNGCGGSLWALDISQSLATTELIAYPRIELASFARDRNGELYAVTSSERIDGVSDDEKSRVYKLIAAPRVEESASPQPLESLADLGCVAPTVPAGAPSSGASSVAGPDAPAGMVEYAINLPAWDDGAEARRFMTIRPSKTRVEEDDAISPRAGSILLKTYVHDDRPVETQMLARRSDGIWEAYLYQWNEAATDALPVPGAAVQCARCHDAETGTLRALSIAQLNRTHRGENQIARLIALGILQGTGDEIPRPSLARLDDESASVVARARAYLDVNCSSCHQPGGDSGAAHFDLRAATPLAMTGICDAGPKVELIGHEAARVLSPGDPERSSISIRMHASDLSAMPPGRTKVDPLGTRIVDAWIRSVELCTPPPAARPVASGSP